MLWIYPPLRLQMPEKAAELAACIGDGSVESDGWCQVRRLSSRRKLESSDCNSPQINPLVVRNAGKWE